MTFGASTWKWHTMRRRIDAVPPKTDGCRRIEDFTDATKTDGWCGGFGLLGA